MKTLSMRYAENFAPECGTISAHNEVIKKYGYVWYGKLGNPISEKYIREVVLKQVSPKILLISSGRAERYWAYISDFSKQKPCDKAIPSYYSNLDKSFKSWFKIIKLEEAAKGVMSKCAVISSGTPLTYASMHSMNPCFKIEYTE